MKPIALAALVAGTAGLLIAGCSIRTERVVDRPVATERTVVHDTTTVPATTTVYTR
jgi:hypothetical protein